jgi:hypothetical protein
MTITLENNNNIIIHALEKMIAFARDNNHLFAAQCVWWLASIMGLERELIILTNNLQFRVEVTVVPAEVADLSEKVPKSLNDDRQDKELKDSQEFLRDSRRLRELTNLNSSRKTKEGCVNQLASTKKSLRAAKQKRGKDHSRTEGIEATEIQGGMNATECLRCAWPSDRKGTHRVKDCIRPINLDKGNASYPKGRNWQRLAITRLESSSCETSAEEEDSLDTE